MSSSPAFQSSPPFGSRRKSKFTYKHLTQLSLFSTLCPLRVVAHVDLDAFYAQCETVRLGVPEDQPLAVQQWQSLIAVNYPAREFGISRFVTAAEAQKKCPDVILQHVATWKEGEAKWAYHDDAFTNIATHKVALDHYRGESKKILAVIKDTLAASPIQKVEKASIDEVFIDLSAQTHAVLLERFVELRGPPPYDDPTENLPRPPTTALDWHSDALVDLDDTETEEDDPDWDDIAMLIGSEIIRDVRAAIRERLKYTTSAGISKNKMLAKLGSGYKKPNSQTVIRNRAIQQFLGGFKFTKIRMLGGKLGDEIVKKFGTDLVKLLLDQPIEELEKQLGSDGTGTWLWGLIRGEDLSEVNPRTLIKSMLSAKSFTVKVNDIQSAGRWLRIFAADIFSRCMDEGVLEHKRRPKTITLHHRSGNTTRSKQTTIPQGLRISEELLLNLANKLLAEVVASGHVWPCSNLSLSVGSFEESTRSMGIGNFLVHGDEAKALLDNERQRTGPRIDTYSHPPPQKKRKTDDGGIARFFGSKEQSKSSDSERSPYTRHDHTSDGDCLSNLQIEELLDEQSETGPFLDEEDISRCSVDDNQIQNSALPPPSNQHSPTRETTSETFFCSRCSAYFPIEHQTEHEDWHVAKDLSEEWRAQDRQRPAQTSTAVPQRTPTPGGKPTNSGKGRGRPPGSSKSSEKGQLKLTFGRT